MDKVIRLLNAEKDRDVLIEAYDWRDSAPQWFRESLDIWQESKEEYLENVKSGELHYCLWVDDIPIAVLRLIEAQPFILNLHLSVKRKSDPATLIRAAASIITWLFDNLGIKGMYGYLPTRNRGVSRIYEALGFTDTGIRVWKGFIHNKFVEWKHYSINNPNLVNLPKIT